MTSERDTEPSDAEQILRDARYAVPTRRPGHVSRSRLREVLDTATGASLVLVSAPAGTGKTTLAAEWAHDEIEAGATWGWITLEDGGSDFWADFVGCVLRLGLRVPDDIVSASQTRLLGRSNLTALAAALLEPGRLVTVVVDGLELDRLDLAHEIDLLLRHTAGRLRLVAVTRVDPVLPLYRYRLAEMMVELRVADLAFSDAEAAELLRNCGVELPVSVVHDLNQRVSGWAAGLRFAARALAAVPDPTEVLAPMLSQVHDINEYLVGEVLNTQGFAAREVMLAVSVPDLILPGLAEELAGPAAPRILADLSHGRAFVEQVQDQPGCYRFYPFFRELLRSQLAYEQPSAFVQAHLTCARWFEQQGLLHPAVEHLAAAGAWDEVAAIVVHKGLVGELMASGATSDLARLGLRIPASVQGDAAAVVRAAAELANGDPDRCAAELARIRSVAAQAAGGAVGRCAAAVDAVRSAFADDEATASRVTRQAQELLRSAGADVTAGDTVHLVALVDLARGVAAVREGDLVAGARALGTAAESATAMKFPAFLAMCRAYRALAEVRQGESARARSDAMRSLTATIRMGEPSAHSHAVALTALARLKLDEDPATAWRLLQPALESRALRDDPVAGSVARLVTAGIEHPATPPARRMPGRVDQRGWDLPVPDIVEDLTPKELEVLGHLAELLTTEEIAEKMYVSVNTVRTHIRSILRKLGVNRRNAAIRKARQLHLLDR